MPLENEKSTERWDLRKGGVAGRDTVHGPE